MLYALKATIAKLQYYYEKTQSELDVFYNKTTLLDSSRDDILFYISEWQSKLKKRS